MQPLFDQHVSYLWNFVSGVNKVPEPTTDLKQFMGNKIPIKYTSVFTAIEVAT